MNYFDELESRWQFKGCGRRAAVGITVSVPTSDEVVGRTNMFDEPGSGRISDTGRLAGVQGTSWLTNCQSFLMVDLANFCCRIETLLSLLKVP